MSENGDETKDSHNYEEDTNGSHEKSTVLKRGRDEDEDDQSQKKNRSESEQFESNPGSSSNPGTAEAKPVAQHITYEEVQRLANAQKEISAALPGVSPTSLLSATVTALNPAVNMRIESILSPSGDSEIIKCTQEKVGQIIGSKGAVIQEMQTRTGAKIYVNQNFPEGVLREVNISGTPPQVKAAGELVRRVILEGPTAIHVNSLIGGPSIEVTVDCPQALVGRVIGSNGATIKELQLRSGAKIQIEQDFPAGVPRKIKISGTQTAVTTATKLVSHVMENGLGLPGQGILGSAAPAASPYGMMGAGGMGAYGPPMGMGMGMGMPTGYGMGAGGHGGSGPQTHIIECAKPMVGRIIGRGGEIINKLQAESGAKMQIEQSTIPCKIMITGTPHQIAVASQKVSEIMMNQSNAHLAGSTASAPSMGGAAGAYGAGPQAAYGGYPQQQQYPGMTQPMVNQPQFGGYPGAAPGMQPYQMQQQQYGQPYGANPYGQPQANPYGVPQAVNPMIQQSTYQPTAAVSAGPKPLPSPWSEHKTDEGTTYYYNSVTQQSQWERPV